MKQSAHVTIKDVARVAEVGIATVSRVVHNNPSVASNLKARVHKAMEVLGYEPNPAAQTMRTRSSRTIACAIRDISIPEFATFVRAAESAIRQAGYTLILTNTEEAVGKELELIRLWSRRRVDGLLLTKSVEHDEALNAAIGKAGIPVVFIDRDASPTTDAVVVDHRRAMRAAVDYLVSLGHVRIALLTGRTVMRPGRERLAGFQEAMRVHNLEPRPGLVSTRSFYAEDAFRQTSLMLSAETGPTAIIAGGMSLLSGVLRAVALSGKTLGSDISLIAGCDSELAELTTPPVTAVRWDIPAWGRISAQLLLDQIGSSSEVTGREVVLPTELVIRSSCGRVSSRSDRNSI